MLVPRLDYARVRQDGREPNAPSCSLRGSIAYAPTNGTGTEP